MGFIVIGALGVFLLAVSFVFDDLLDAVLPDGWLSAPAIGAFLAAGGFVGYLVRSSTGAPDAVAVGAGLVAGTALGWAAVRIARALEHMATDPTPTAGDLVGREGRVVTPIAAGRTGEVLVRLAGQPIKVTARADEPVATGVQVVVVAVLSSTFVEVQPAERFWAPDPLGELP